MSGIEDCNVELDNWDDDDIAEWAAGPLCTCGALHDQDELDWNKCDSCGKAIE